MIIFAACVLAVILLMRWAIKRSRRRDLAVGICFQTGTFHTWRCTGERAMRMHYQCVACGQRAWFKLNYENPTPPPFFDQSPRFTYSRDWSEDDYGN